MSEDGTKGGAASEFFLTALDKLSGFGADGWQTVRHLADLVLGGGGGAIADAVRAMTESHRVRALERAKVDAEVDRRTRIASTKFFEQLLKDPAANGLTLGEAHALTIDCQRALDRFDTLSEVGRRAIPRVGPEAKPQDVAESWARRFRDHAQYATEPELQELWGRILAGEVNAPGSISPHTMHVASLVPVEYAEKFARLRPFSWLTSSRLQLVLVGTDLRLNWDDVVAITGLTFDDLLALEDLNLVERHANPQEGFALGLKRPRAMVHATLGISITATPRIFDTLPAGPLRLTSAGEQILRMCEFTHDTEEYTNGCIETLSHVLTVERG